MRRTSIVWLAVALLGCDDRKAPDIDTDTGAMATGTATTPPTPIPPHPATATPAERRHLELLQEAAARDTRSDAAQMRLAKHCVKLSRWKQARAAVDAALSVNPDNEEAKRLKRYLPELERAETVAERRAIEMKMDGESLATLGERLRSAGAEEAMEQRLTQRQNELRERFGITDDMLASQQARHPDASLRLTQALEAIAEPSAREVHIRKILDAEPARLDAWEKLLDVLIEQRRYDDAAREVAVARRAAPGDLVLRLYEHHLGTLGSADDEGRQRARLKSERLTLLTMITDAKVGRLAR